MIRAVKVNFGWKLGPFIMASVNHSPARNKKTTTALPITNSHRNNYRPNHYIVKPGFVTFLAVSPAEVDKLIREYSSKQCQLDSMQPTCMAPQICLCAYNNLALQITSLSQAHLWPEPIAYP